MNTLLPLSRLVKSKSVNRSRFAYRSESRTTFDRFVAKQLLRISLTVSFLFGLALAGCAIHKSERLRDRVIVLSGLEPREQIESPADGKILVFVDGDVRKRGPHWIMEDDSILTVEKISGAGDEGVDILEPSYVMVRREVDGRILELRYDLRNRTQNEKEMILLKHGDRVIFPWTNCW